jgi:hypothetical protein
VRRYPTPRCQRAPRHRRAHQWPPHTDKPPFAKQQGYVCTERAHCKHMFRVFQVFQLYVASALFFFWPKRQGSPLPFFLLLFNWMKKYKKNREVQGLKAQRKKRKIHHMKLSLQSLRWSCLDDLALIHT